MMRRWGKAISMLLLVGVMSVGTPIVSFAEEATVGETTGEEAQVEGTQLGETQNLGAVIPEEPVANSKVYISDFTYGKEQATAGETLTGVVTIKNTDTDNSVKHVTVSMGTDTKGFRLKSGTNARYIDKIKKNESVQCSFDIYIEKDVAPGQYAFPVTFEYETESGSVVAGNTNCLINVIQPANVEIEVINECQEAEDGDIVLVTVNIMNLGRSSIYNARCVANGEEISSMATSFVGEVAGDTATSCQLQLLMDKSKENKEDTFSSGDVILQYEDADGNAYEAKSNVGIRITAIQSADTEDKQAKPIRQWWYTVGGIALGCLVMVAVCVTGKKWSKRREKKAEM